MKFFTSDLHFNHKNIVRFTSRDMYTTQEDHDMWLTQLWNSQVKTGDLVYHLGDFSFSHSPYTLRQILARLNGSKVMIVGNHDDYRALVSLQGLHGIAKVVHYDEVVIRDKKAMLFHYPIGSWKNQKHGSYHLHGHCHGNYTQTRGRMLDVGLDNAIGQFGKAKFFTESEIYDYMEAIPVATTDSHRKVESEQQPGQVQAEVPNT